jgi:hypothetical protein
MDGTFAMVNAGLIDPHALMRGYAVFGDMPSTINTNSAGLSSMASSNKDSPRPPKSLIWDNVESLASPNP